MANLECSTCDYIAPSEFHLGAHIDYNHSNIDYNHFQEAKSNVSSTSNNLQCCQCDYLGTSDSDLVIHEDEVHFQTSLPSNDNSKKYLITEATIVPTNTAVHNQTNVRAKQVQKRQYEPEVKEVKKPKLKCLHCVKIYVNAKWLESHIKTMHPQKQNSEENSSILKSIISKVEALDKKFDEMETKERNSTARMDEVVTSLNTTRSSAQFSEIMRTCDIAFKQAQSEDRKKENVIRAAGFNVKNYQSEKDTKNLTVQQVNIFNMTEIIEQIIQNHDFEIIKAQSHKKKDIIDVHFSKTTNINSIFAQLESYSKSNGLVSVSKVVLPSTKVRFSMLETIGKAVIEEKKTKTFTVKYIQMKPCLLISEVDKETDEKMTKNYEFPDAVFTFCYLLDSCDFQNAIDLCRKYGIKGNDLLQFVVEFQV
jgi:hypothetical protein